MNVEETSELKEEVTNSPEPCRMWVTNKLFIDQPSVCANIAEGTSKSWYQIDDEKNLEGRIRRKIKECSNTKVGSDLNANRDFRPVARDTLQLSNNHLPYNPSYDYMLSDNYLNQISLT